MPRAVLELGKLARRLQGVRKINILGADYEIRLREMAEEYGTTNGNNRIIQLDHMDSTDEQFISTFLHECMHAVLCEAGVDNLLGDEGSTEEALVTALEHGMWPVIRVLLEKVLLDVRKPDSPREDTHADR